MTKKARSDIRKTQQKQLQCEYKATYDKYSFEAALWLKNIIIEILDIYTIYIHSLIKVE